MKHVLGDVTDEQEAVYYASVVFFTRFVATVFSLTCIISVIREVNNLPDVIVPESVLESSRYMLQITHSAGSSRLSTLRLLAPLI